MLFQCRASVKDVGPTLKQYWVNGSAAAAKYTAEPVLGQRGRQFVGIELVMGCDNVPTLNRNRVGMPTSCVS